MAPPERTEGRGTGTRFHITLLFSDLCNFTALGEASDPEDVGDLRRAIMERAKRVIEDHRGTVNQVYGDGILAVFGYPHPEEHDVRRAIEAALDLHETVRAIRSEAMHLPPGFEVRMHSGVHSGLVFVREGSTLYGRYDLTGDAVNTAQRLCGVASQDQVVVSQATLQGLEAFFEVEDISPLSLKGKERPTLASIVLRRSGLDSSQARQRRGLTPFVGRTLEMKAVHEAMADVTAGRSRTLWVKGPAGIGKSRFLESFRRRIGTNVMVFCGACEPFGNVAPLHPFAQAFRQTCLGGNDLPIDAAIERLKDWIEGIDPFLREHLPALERLLSLSPWLRAQSTDRETLENEVVGAMAAVFSTVGSTQPVAIVLDDWHWADDASKQALVSITRAVVNGRVLVLVGSRPSKDDDIVSRDAVIVELQPFTYDESSRAVHSLLPNTLDMGVSAAIHRRCGGSPLFLEELCRSLPSDPANTPMDPRIPTTIHRLIQGRVARLPQTDLELLHAASVIGTEFPLWLLEKAAGHADPTALARLAGEDLVYASQTGGAFQFKHGITRDVVYESVPIQRRRALHGQVAHAIEARSGATGLADHYEALAHHYAGSQDHARAATFAELAGDKATATPALDRSRFQYAAALAALDALSPSDNRERWLRISAKWASACIYSPARSQLEILRRAVEYARELHALEAVARAEYWRGWIQYALGNQESAIAHCREALGIAERASIERLRVQLVANLGQCHAAAGEYDDAFRYLDEGIEYHKTRAVGVSRRGVAVGFAYALGTRALVHGDRGNFGDAYQEMNEALAMVEGSGHAIEGSLFGLLGMIQLWQGQWEACLETVRRARAAAEQVHGPYVLAMAQTAGGYAAWTLRSSQTALAELRQSVDWLEAREIHLYVSFNYAHLADALVDAMKPEEARAYALRALRRAEEKDPIGETMAHRVLARLAGPGAVAESHLESARQSAIRRGSRRDLALTRLLAVELRPSADRDTARCELIELRDAFTTMNMPVSINTCDRLLAVA
jgi:class 3 adenylate cyclase/tetratricopeptide (TPR) repeat protein